MADYTILYWQNIPSMVEAREGRAKKKLQLSDRFQVLIDAVAMRKGLVGTDAYIEQWRRGAPQSRAGDVEEVAAAVATELEQQYDAIKAAATADE
ncbi:MAG: virulence factor [Rhodospirillales bacterium]|nr:MAG: virulence factor [Rhodospirillales bacterium]